MTRYPCPDPKPPTEADLDTPEMVETAAAIERNERHLRMLAELAELGMEMARTIVQNAKENSEPAADDAVARKPPVDPAKAFSIIALAVRRTIALEAHLTEEVKTRRAGLFTQRARRRADLDQAHRGAVNETIDEILEEAISEDFPDLKCEGAERLLSDLQDLLFDADEFRDYLQRPIGETIAKLCTTLGLDPDFCVQDGETWMVRRAPYSFEARLPPLDGEGQDAKHPGWGTLDEAPRRASP